MGASAPKKSFYLGQIESKTKELVRAQANLAHQKSMLSTTPTKDACKREIERYKGEVAKLKAQISTLKMQMRNAPKG